VTVLECSFVKHSHGPLGVKYSKESTKTLCLLKTGNKVVEVG
jgi:hypothetical protein